MQFTGGKGWSVGMKEKNEWTEPAEKGRTRQREPWRSQEMEWAARPLALFVGVQILWSRSFNLKLLVSP